MFSPTMNNPHKISYMSVLQVGVWDFRQAIGSFHNKKENPPMMRHHMWCGNFHNTISGKTIFLLNVEISPIIKFPLHFSISKHIEYRYPSRTNDVVTTSLVGQYRSSTYYIIYMIYAHLRPLLLKCSITAFLIFASPLVLPLPRPVIIMTYGTFLSEIKAETKTNVMSFTSKSDSLLKWPSSMLYYMNIFGRLVTICGSYSLTRTPNPCKKCTCQPSLFLTHWLA